MCLCLKLKGNLLNVFNVISGNVKNISFYNELFPKKFSTL